MEGNGLSLTHAVTLTFDLLNPNLISTSMNPHTSVTKLGWNSLHWLLRYGVHKVFWTHRLTHGRTHPETACLRHRRVLVAEASN